jgi:transcriptional regulator GlxA family with amidase domain
MKETHMQNQDRPPTVGILIFDDVEVLDFCGPFEVFSTARPAGEHSDTSQIFTVLTIAEQDRIITCRGGLLVKPHATIDHHPPLDILVVPGGQGTRRERHNQRILDWIAQQGQHTNLTTSVCTGAFLLAERGLLDNQRATTHWNSIEWMRNTYPAINMLADTRVVDEGHIITSAGISAGIDMSLHVVSRLYGFETAKWTARRMEYDWSAHK